MKTELIHQKDGSNKFWNIVINANTHTVTYGRIGTSGTSKTKEFDNDETALKDALSLIKSKKKKGYQEFKEEMITVRNAHTFAGKPIQDYTISINPKTAVKVWCEYDDEVSMNQKLDKLAAAPNVAEMDTLVIGAWPSAGEGSKPPMLDKLIELKDTFSGLKHLFIGDMDSEDCEMSWINQGDYTGFYKHFPALETFGIKGAEGLKLGKINLPNLKNLVIETGGINHSVIKDIIDSDLKNLRHLELWLGTEDYGCTVEIEHLEPILNGEFPALKYLGLKNYYKQDELAVKLQGAKVINGLHTLDMSMGTMKDTGAEALFNNNELVNLEYINCRHHYISNEWMSKLQWKFSKDKINLEGQEEADQYSDETYYYVEIGE